MLTIVLLPLLLSPQVWYIFSYFNSEAFGLFIILLTSFQMVAPDSTWNRLLEGRVSVAKAVFAVDGLFVFFYVAWRLFHGRSVLSK